MMNPTPKRKKFLVGLFSFLLLFTTSYGVLMAKPEEAQAQWYDLALPSFTPIWDTIKPILIDVIKIFIIEYAYQDVLDWISGKKDKPAFISNYDDWLLNSADIAASLFLEEELDEWYSVLCNGIDVEIALYWQSEFEARYKMPECTISDIVSNAEGFIDDPGGEWFTFSASFENAQNESAYLWKSFELAKEKEEDTEDVLEVEAVANDGWVLKAGPFATDSIQTPGSLIADYAGKSLNTIFDVQADSESFTQLVAPLLNAAIIRLLKEGVGVDL